MFNCRLIEKITRGQKKMVNRKDLLFSVCMLTCWVGRIKLFQSTKSRSIKKLQRFFPTGYVGDAKNMILEHIDLCMNSGSATSWLCGLGQVAESF